MRNRQEATILMKPKGEIFKAENSGFHNNWSSEVLSYLRRHFLYQYFQSFIMSFKISLACFQLKGEFHWKMLSSFVWPLYSECEKKCIFHQVISPPKDVAF